jgi:NADPH-dependent curcumin reductase CurA
LGFFYKLLKKAVKEGVIQVEETSLEGFENIIFDL